MKRGHIIFLTLSFALFANQILFALAKEFERNGEVYILLNHVGNFNYAIWRTYSPSTKEPLPWPVSTNIKSNTSDPSKYDSEMLNFAVDINRNIFTIAVPKYVQNNPSYLYRQVLDDSKALSDAEGSVSTTSVPELNLSELSWNVTNDKSDYGCHSYIHHDQRGSRDNTAGTDLYRTITGSDTSRRARKSGSGSWTGFWVKKPTFVAYNSSNWKNQDLAAWFHPTFSNKAIALPVYKNKKFGYIPNGAWFSSWRYKKGCSYYFQVYRDKVEEKDKNYDLVKWTATNQNNLEKAIYTAGTPTNCVTTRDITYKRWVLAGCLDGCGGSSGNQAVKGKEYQVLTAFQPTNGGSQVYTYKRAVGASTGTLTKSGGSRSYQVIGNENSDTNWIGVSTKGNNEDYVYLLGKTQIEKWIKDLGYGSMSNTDIKAVTVSNQWDEKGGILYAFDGASGHNYIIRMPFNGASPEKMKTIQVSELLSQINANNSLDDIATDGFGNLYISLTRPSTAAKSPSTYGYNLNKARSYSVVEGEESTTITFDYLITYYKSTYKLNAEGGNLKNIGTNFVIGSKTWHNQVEMTKANYEKFKTQVAGKSLPWSGMNTLVNSLRKGSVSTFWSTDTIPSDGLSKLAVINVPTPPTVYSLGNTKKSYLDIIGAYYGEVPPIPDTDRNATNQQESRRNCLNLQTDQLYYFMVENYPIPESPQNPNVEKTSLTPYGADYDNDGKVGGFISTIANAGRVNQGIKYYWQLWAIQDYKKKPYVDSKGNPVANKMGKSNTYYTTLYAPLPGKYILTCCAKYSWYDYDKVDFSGGNYETKVNYLKRAVNEANGYYTRWALAAGPGTMAAPSAKNANDSTNGLASAIKSLYSNYVQKEGEPSKATIATNLAKQILNDAISSNGINGSFEAGYSDPNYYIAYESISVDGEVPQPDSSGSEDTVLIQRHCINTSRDNWQPKEVSSGKQQMNPNDKYHGIDSTADSYWRICVGSQTVFLASDADNALYRTGNSAIDKKMYDYITSKLTNVNIIGAKTDIKFLKNGKDIRWQKGSVPELYVHFEYKTVDANGKIVTKPLAMEGGKNVFGNNEFIYYKIKGNDLPPTDPFVGVLTIQMSRTLEYDAYVYDKSGNILMSDPLRLPKQFKIKGEAKIMVVDNQIPKLKYNVTSPNALYANTGEALKANINGNPDKIKFTIYDENPLESVDDTINPKYHEDWNVNNRIINDEIKNNATKKNNPSYNYLPVYNVKNRKIYLTFKMPQLDESGNGVSKNNNGKVIETIATYTLSYLGGESTNQLVLKSRTRREEDTVQHIFSSMLNMEMPLNKLNNGVGEIVAPHNYANNSYGYKPIEFEVYASDCSGNELATCTLNLKMEIDDAIAPFPYGEITEFKNNTGNTIRFPRVAITTNDYDTEKSQSANDWISSYVNMVKYCRTTRLQNDYSVSSARVKDGYVSDSSGNILTFGSGVIGKNSSVYGAMRIFVLPRYDLNDDAITNFSSISNGTLSWNKAPYKNTKDNFYNLPPATIILEENVEALIRAGGIDNSGQTRSKILLYNFDINQEKKKIETSYPDWKVNNSTNQREGKPDTVRRVVFRQGKDVQFPYLVPIKIEVQDNSRGWDNYQYTNSSDEFAMGTWKVKKGNKAGFTRVLKTCIPVYGVALDTRVLEKHIKPIE